MMEPASTQVRTLSFDTDALGQAQTWVLHHRGLEYTGEVIVAESVDLAWGRPLEGGLSFRLVFFTVPRRIAQGLIEDSRIAMAVPIRSPYRVQPTLDRELKALAQRFATSFSQGRIYTHPEVRVRPRGIFEEEHPESWADRLASAVLSMACPSLPFDHSAFPHTLTTEGVAAVYRGLIQGDPDATGVAEAFGPGLGLSWPEFPALFDASGCRAVAIVQREVETRGGEMPAQEVLRVLAYNNGLVRPLAVLYLLAFVRQVHGEAELVAGHGVVSRQGGPFLADRITWDLVPELSFSESLVDYLGMLRLQPSVTWDTVLPYAALLAEGLESAKDAKSVADQERRLVETLKGMGSEIADARETLNTLEASLGRIPDGALEALERLRVLCAVSDFREFYSVAQERLQGASGLREALEVYRRVVGLSTLAPAIAQAKQYLDSMTFGRSHQELLLQRDSVAARFEANSLLDNPSLWSSIEEGFQRLRAQYANAYLSHHLRYHQEALELRHRLEALTPQVEALAMFSKMPELGEPVGTEVPQLSQEVAASLRACSGEVDEPSLQAAPYCHACQLPLDVEVPRRNATLLFGATETAMREYNRRLSSHAVRRILAHPTKEQLDRFVDVVQVADPSALANVLDDGVVEFLRQFLKSG